MCRLTARWKSGDVIQKIDGHTVRTLDDIRGIVADKSPGEKVTITLLRGGKPKTVEATLAVTPTAAP